MSKSQTSLSAMYRDASVKAVAKAAPRQRTYEVRHHFNKCSPLTFGGDSEVNGAYTTRYPLPPSSRPAKDTYYIIRMRTRGKKKTGRRRVFIEFLFRDGDNYLIAWRVYSEPEECETAHWIFFTDTASHMNEDLFKHMSKKCNYVSGYADALSKVEIHGKVLEDIAIFLTDLYKNHKQDTHDLGSLYFHTLFVLFGECPHFAPLDDSSAGSIVKMQKYVDPLGCGCLYDLIKSWKKISFTILLLKLLLVEESMIAGIKRTRPHLSDTRRSSPQFQDLFDEAKEHRRKIEERLASLYKDTKEIDRFSALNKQVIEADGAVGDATLQRMVTRFLHLVKFDGRLVPAILVRQDNFEGALGLDLR